MTELEKLASRYVDEKCETDGFYDAFIAGYNAALRQPPVSGELNCEMKLNEAIELLKDYRKGDFVDDYKLCEAIDTVVNEVEKECDHPYAFVVGGGLKPEKCLKCGKILSD